MLYVFHYKNDTNNNRLGRDAKVEQIQIQKKMMMTGQSEFNKEQGPQLYRFFVVSFVPSRHRTILRPHIIQLIFVSLDLFIKSFLFFLSGADKNIFLRSVVCLAISYLSLILLLIHAGKMGHWTTTTTHSERLIRMAKNGISLCVIAPKDEIELVAI